MSIISKVSALVNGAQRQVDLSVNTVSVGALQINGATSGAITHNANATTTPYSVYWPAAQASGTQYLENDGAGNLSWATPAAAGANTALSNLSGVAINTSLLPGADDSINLGSASFSWASANIHSLADASGTSIDVYGRALLDSSAATQLSWSTSGVEFNQLTASTVPYLNSSKILVSSAVTPTELGYVSGVTSSIQTQLNGKLSLTGGTMSGAIDMGSNQIHNVTDPSSAQDAATKNYVDSVALGLKPKQAVRAASTANIDLSSALINGAVVDGVTLATGDRVLIKDQSTASENGIYIVAASGAASRSSDFNLASEVNGAWVAVQEGTVAAGHVYVQYGTVTTLGTDPVNFEFYNPIASLIGGDMITVSGSTISVDLLTNGGLKSSNPGNSSGQLEISLEASNPSLQIDGSNELGVKLDGSRAITTGASGIGVNVDNSTIDISANALEVKNGGISASKLGSVTDGVTLDQSGAGSTLEIKSGGVGTTQLASASVTAAKLGTVTDGITTDQNGSGSTIEVLNAPAMKRTFIAGQTFTANTSYAVRWGVTANGETAGRVYAADITTSSYDLFYVIGMASSAAGVSAGGSIVVTTMGSFALSSADTAFGSGTDGEAVFLTASGTFSLTAPSSSGQAVTRIGVLQIRSATVTSNIIDVLPQVIGVN